MNDLKSVGIPASLYQAIEEKLKDSDFNSVSDFITHAVRKTLSEFKHGSKVVSDEEKKAIQKRLRDLGYIE